MTERGTLCQQTSIPLFFLRFPKTVLETTTGFLFRLSFCVPYVWYRQREYRSWAFCDKLRDDIWIMLVLCVYTGCTQKNGAVWKVNKKFISHLTRAQRTPSAAATVQVSHALPAVRFSCLLRGRGASFQHGVAAGKGFLCAPFRGVQICDNSAARVSGTV